MHIKPRLKSATLRSLSERLTLITAATGILLRHGRLRAERNEPPWYSSRKPKVPPLYPSVHRENPARLIGPDPPLIMPGRVLFQERPLNVPHFKVGNVDHFGLKVLQSAYKLSVLCVCVRWRGAGGVGGHSWLEDRSAGIRIHFDIAGMQTLVAGSKASRACTCALGGAGTAAGRQRPDLRRGLLRGRRGVLDLCSRGSRGSLPHSAVGCKLCVHACVPCVSVHKIGREGAAAVASRLVGLVGLVDVLWRGSRQSPSRRPEQRYQLQGPFRARLCGGGGGDQSDRWRRKRRARGERGVGAGAPASLLEDLPARPGPPAHFEPKPFSPRGILMKRIRQDRRGQMRGPKPEM